MNQAKVLKEMKSVAEELDWKVVIEEDTWSFNRLTDAGEDLWFAVYSGEPDEIVDGIWIYYENFDAQEHAIRSFRRKGSPHDLRILLDDADDIDRKIHELYLAFNEILIKERSKNV